MSAEAENRTVRELIPIVERLLGRPVKSLSPLGGGRNSRVYRLETDRGPLVLKQYFRHKVDPRDRLGAEYVGFAFARANGLTDVPVPLARDDDRDLAVYQFIPGLPADRTPGPDELDQALDFLIGLKGLIDAAGAAELPVASEACFSLPDLAANLTGRFNRLAGLTLTGDEYDQLNRLLSEEIEPLQTVLIEQARTGLIAAGVDPEADLDRADRTLSPSDFGFHNAIMQADGRLAFLDFEYFGWDDPAKTVSDLLLHPAMDLTDDQKRIIVRRLVPALDRSGRLKGRLQLFFPLYGLKWVFILLNEFVPADAARRKFAGGQDSDRRRVRLGRLALARERLSGIRGEYDHFPYFG